MAGKLAFQFYPLNCQVSSSHLSKMSTQEVVAKLLSSRASIREYAAATIPDAVIAEVLRLTQVRSATWYFSTSIPRGSRLWPFTARANIVQHPAVQCDHRSFGGGPREHRASHAFRQPEQCPWCASGRHVRGGPRYVLLPLVLVLVQSVIPRLTANCQHCMHL
jgi:hypothetical protein